MRHLVELLASIHYIPQINLNQLEGKEKPTADRELLIKIGIAGFAFGNIMLLSMPEYLSFGRELDEEYRNFFGWVNIFLSLPVLFYSSNEYLLSAYKNLRHKIINIDLPISLGILALSLQSYYEILSGTGPGYLDSFTGFVFFLLIGKWYQNKTYQSLSFDRDYKSYFPVAAIRVVMFLHRRFMFPLTERAKHILPLKANTGKGLRISSAISRPITKCMLFPVIMMP